MRFLALDLRAFGPFTNQTIDLSAGNEGLHIIYGPNEAGKSSALRALGALLYGIDARSPDNFLHPHPALRIGATLRHSNGTVLHVVRRKGNKDTLLDPKDDRPLPPDMLAPYLGRVDQHLFEALFGISHATLVEGGKSLLAQGGEVGQALFSAGLGSANLHQVITALEEEAAALFSRTARKTSIAQSLTRLTEARNAASAESLSTRDWEDKRELLQALGKQKDELKERVRRVQEEKSRLERIQSARPFLAERARHRKTAQDLAGAKLLPEDFGSRHQDALSRLRLAGQDGERAQVALTGLEEKLGALKMSPVVLDEKDTVVALHEELGSVNKGAEDTVKLEARAREQRMEAERIFRTIRPDSSFAEVEELRPLQSLRARVTELEKKRVPLEGALTQATEATESAQADVDAAERWLAETPEPKDSSALRQAISRVHKAGDLDAEILAARETFTEHQRKFRTELARLQPAPSSEGLQTLPVPLLETVQDFRERWTKITGRLEQLAGEQKQIESDLVACEQKIQILLVGGEVPCEQDLAAARRHRDAGWAMVRRAWSDFQGPERVAAEFDPDRPLAEAFERSVVSADDVSDRLRREATRVLNHEGLKKERERLLIALDATVKERDGLNRDFSKLQVEWEASWVESGVEPLAPRQMESWLSVLAVVRTHHATLEATTKTGKAQRERWNELVSGLAEETRTAGGTVPHGAILAEALEAAQAQLDALDEAIRLRKETKDSLPGLKELVIEKNRRACTAGKDLDAWRLQWEELMGELGLRASAFESEAVGLLDEVDALFEALDEAEKYDLRIKGIQEEAESFEGRVRELCRTIAEDLLDEPATTAARELHQRLSLAQQEKRLRDEHLKAVETHSATLEDAKAREKTAKQDLEALCAEAECASFAELSEIEERSARLRSAQSRLAEIETQLQTLTFGTDREAFERTASETDPDSLPGRIQDLAGDLAELQVKVEEKSQQYGAEEKNFEAMDARATAANAAQEAQEIRAQLRSDAERYVQAALAARVLREEIDRFREENEDPMLKRASAFFSRMTRGRYARLRADYGERDERVLHGVRADGAQVPVEGMSDGTRDQVYLALRLAALEQHVARAEPLPFVVDDVLVQFDDERGAATLETLADFAERVQVILFTHHQHVVEAARSVAGRRSVIVHELAAGPD